MSIDLKEPNSTQLARMARAQSMTKVQLELARDLLTVRPTALQGADLENAVLVLAQVLATNYLAEVTAGKT